MYTHMYTHTRYSLSSNGIPCVCGCIQSTHTYRLVSGGPADGGLAVYKTCGIAALLDQTEVYGAVFELSDQAVGGAAHHTQNSKKVQMEGDTL